MADPLAPPAPAPTVSESPTETAVVKPGSQSSELKLSAGIFILLQALAGAWIALISANTLHVPDWATPLVPIITTIASAWVGKTYTDSRTAVKVTAVQSLK